MGERAAGLIVNVALPAAAAKAKTSMSVGRSITPWVDTVVRPPLGVPASAVAVAAATKQASAGG